MRDKIMIHKIVYLGDKTFLVNGNHTVSESEIREKFTTYYSYDTGNTNHYPKLNQFVRKLKLLDLLNKSDKHLIGTVVFKTIVKPTNMDYASLYPQHMLRIESQSIEPLFDKMYQRIIKQRYDNK